MLSPKEINIRWSDLNFLYWSCINYNGRLNKRTINCWMYKFLQLLCRAWTVDSRQGVKVKMYVCCTHILTLCQALLTIISVSVVLYQELTPKSEFPHMIVENWRFNKFITGLLEVKTQEVQLPSEETPRPPWPGWLRILTDY